MSDSLNIPSDLAACHALLREQMGQLTRSASILAEQAATIAAQTTTITAQTATVLLTLLCSHHGYFSILPRFQPCF